MQTFLPSANFKESARVLDSKRLGKERLEAWQILKINLAINNPDDYFVTDVGLLNLEAKDWSVPSVREWKKEGLKLAWENHPAVLMWRGYEVSLAKYGCAVCSQWIKRGYKDTFFYSKFAQIAYDELDIYGTGNDPNWLGNGIFHSSHRAALLYKNYNWYKQFNWKETPSLNYFWPITKENK